MTLSNGHGDDATIQLIANFPDITPDPLPFFPAQVRNTNPFAMLAVGDQLFVTDGGQNLIWQVDLPTGAFSELATFPPIPNPLPLGAPVLEAVPAGIAYSGGQLLVTLFRGFPFPVGASAIELVDPSTGSHVPFVSGLTTALDVLPLRTTADGDYLVLQHASGPVLSGPGLLLRFEAPEHPPTVLANCLDKPTSMALDEKTRTIYVTELLTGRILALSIHP